MTKRRGRGDGGIRQRADGRFEGTIELGWENGKRRRKSVYGRSPTEVKEKIRRVHGDLDAGRPPLDERTKVSGWLDVWLADFVKPNRSHGHWRNCESAVRLYWKPTIGHLRLARLTAADVQRTINDLRNRGLAPDSVRLAHATLRAALETALRMDLGLVHRNVAKLVEPIPIAKEEVVPFSEEEMGRILAVASADRLGAYVKIAVALGLRPGEGRALTWDDVVLDGENPSLRVRQAFSRAPGGERLGPPKTPRSRRTIQLPPELVDVLRQHRRQQLEERMKAGPAWQGDGFVFTRPDGRPLTDSTLRRWFASLSQRAEVDGHQFYDLRHTAASLLLAEGVHPRDVMEILGHSTYRLTMDTYAHVMPATQREAARAMGRALTRISEGGNTAFGGQFGGQGRSKV